MVQAVPGLESAEWELADQAASDPALEPLAVWFAPPEHSVEFRQSEAMVAQTELAPVAPLREEVLVPEAASQVSVTQAFVVQVFARIRAAEAAELLQVLLLVRWATVVSGIPLPLSLARAIVERFVLLRLAFRCRRFVAHHREPEFHARLPEPVLELPVYRSP
jgi:hypothetical protein